MRHAFVVQLLVDDTPASIEARLILERNGIEYVALPSSSSGLPAAIVGHQVHMGPTAIGRLAEAMKRQINGELSMNIPFWTGRVGSRSLPQ